MGTRSLTKIIETCETSIAHEDNNNEVYKERKPITCMYRQYDGYLDGHGLELAEWLAEHTLVNGIPVEHTTKEKPKLMFNGMDCLAAQMFSHFKDGAGGIYCMHPDAEDCGEEYLYEISEIDNQIHLTVYEIGYESDPIEIFHGTPKELLTKIELNYA